ncbi:MAG: hypothetical protein ACOYMN_17605 [Roseimicrobium sp.]
MSAFDHEAANADARGRIQPVSNREVLEIYRDHFALPFRAAAAGVPPRFRSFHYGVGKLTVTGKPTLALEFNGGRIRYVYLIKSKNWDDRDARFAVNLLSEIVTSNILDTIHADVEARHCRTGAKLKGQPLSSRDRGALEELSELHATRGLC